MSVTAGCTGLHAPDFEDGDCESRDCHLDAGVSEIVYGLWEAGIKTETSCEGGGPERGHGLLERTVRFGSNDEEAGRVGFQKALDLGMPAFQLRKCWVNPARSLFWWELIFDRWVEWRRGDVAPEPHAT